MSSYQQQPSPYTRRVVNSLTAPGAIRPDGSGVGMTLAELVDELIQVMRENTAEVRALRADLKRRWEGTDG